jgi:hypothetical protein
MYGLSFLFVKIALCSRPDWFALTWRHTSSPLHPPWRLIERSTNVRFDAEYQLSVQRFMSSFLTSFSPLWRLAKAALTWTFQFCCDYYASSATGPGLVGFIRCPLSWQDYPGFCQCLHAIFKITPQIREKSIAAFNLGGRDSVPG